MAKEKTQIAELNREMFMLRVVGSELKIYIYIYISTSRTHRPNRKSRPLAPKCWNELPNYIWTAIYASFNTN